MPLNVERVKTQSTRPSSPFSAGSRQSGGSDQGDQSLAVGHVDWLSCRASGVLAAFHEHTDQSRLSRKHKTGDGHKGVAISPNRSSAHFMCEKKLPSTVDRKTISFVCEGKKGEAKKRRGEQGKMSGEGMMPPGALWTAGGGQCKTEHIALESGWRSLRMPRYLPVADRVNQAASSWTGTLIGIPAFSHI